MPCKPSSAPIVLSSTATNNHTYSRFYPHYKQRHLRVFCDLSASPFGKSFSEVNVTQTWSYFNTFLTTLLVRYGLANEERAKAKYIAMTQDHHEDFQVSQQGLY